MLKPRRFVFAAFHIDTNRINARQKLPAMNQLEQWKRDGVILLSMSEPAFREALSGNDRSRTSKTHGFMFAQPDIDTDHWERRRTAIERILFPTGARTANEKNDVLVVFTADKHRHTLVTNDGASKSQPGGILGNAGKLAALGITVVSDVQAVQIVREKILIRDDRARQYAKETGEPLAPWVGLD